MVENKSSDADLAEDRQARLRARLQELNEEREMLEAANERIMSLLQEYRELLHGPVTPLPTDYMGKLPLSKISTEQSSEQCMICLDNFVENKE